MLNHSSRNHNGSNHVHHLSHKENHNEPSHDKHAGHNVSGFLRLFVICTILTIPVLLLSPMIQHWLGFTILFPGDKYLLAVIAAAIFFYGGWPFLKGLYDEVSQKAIGMMTLIGIAITAAWAYSVAVTFGLAGMDFYWEMATLIDIMLLGHWLEMKSIMGASRSLEMLVQMMPSDAHLIINGNVKDVKLKDVKTNDVLLVKPGEKIPADSEIVSGESHINESMLTGESKPVTKKTGDKVIAGSINGNGSLNIKVLHTGADSYLSKVIKLVDEAQNAKSNTQMLADKAAKWLTFAALGAGIITLIAWLTAGYGFAFALERMVTVMVISCPHALGLAVPLVVSISTSLSASKGLLIRNRTAFESSGKITHIIFDKTGTLTEGIFGVNRFESLDTKYDNNEILKLAASLESHSEHPIASGVMAKLKELNLNFPAAERFNAITGKGIEGVVEGRNLKVVSPGYLKEKNISFPSNLSFENDETVVYVIIDNKLSGYISLSDKVRGDAKPAIDELKSEGIHSIMATGDNERVAQAVAGKLGIDKFYAEVLPHQKLEIIKDLQSNGAFTAMTGDGINDAPALAQADIGIAVGSGTDIAAETADIILVNSSPKDIVSLIKFGKRTYNKIIQNLIWAAGYNIIALPLAAGVLYSFGILLSPAIGAVLMSVSTIVVAINAQLLKKQI